MFIKNLNKKRALAFTSIGILIGFLGIVGARFLNPPEHTHYHANFGLFINDQRDQFDNFTFYEEVQSCSGNAQDNPKHRAHMHDKVNHVVHVHERAVTWSQFFANLGYSLSDKAVTTDQGVFVDGENGKKLTFFLNRQPVSNIANEVIKSEDVLLIDYGSGENIDSNFAQISADAGEYNRRNDPSSCTGSQRPDSWSELKRALEFWE